MPIDEIHLSPATLDEIDNACIGEHAKLAAGPNAIDWGALFEKLLPLIVQLLPFILSLLKQKGVLTPTREQIIEQYLELIAGAFKPQA